MKKNYKHALWLFLLIGMEQNINARDIQKEPINLYISPTGSDSNSGTKEHPFATLTKARDKVREYNINSNSKNFTVWLSGGKYILSETLVFCTDDSAKPGQKRVIK
jgi:hypothetical protein